MLPIISPKGVGDTNMFQAHKVTKNSYTVNEIKELINNNVKIVDIDKFFNFVENGSENLSLIKDVFKGFEVVLKATLSKYKDEVYFEHSTTYIKYKDVLLRPIETRYKSRMFTLYLENTTYIPYFTTEYKIPNNIGKATEKKLNDWYEYLTKIEQDKIDFLNKKNEKIKNNIKELKESFGDNIVWYGNNNEGVVEKNGIRMNFIIDSNGDINYSLQFDYRILTDVNIETFKKLSDNGFAK